MKNKIRVDIKIPGAEDVTYEVQHCELVGGNNYCRIVTDIKCLYGLTENVPPAACPLRIGPVSLNFSFIKEPKNG